MVVIARIMPRIPSSKLYATMPAHSYNCKTYATKEKARI